MNMLLIVRLHTECTFYINERKDLEYNQLKLFLVHV